MFDLLWILPAFPVASFLVLALAGGRLGRRPVELLGVGSVGMSTAAAGSPSRCAS